MDPDVGEGSSLLLLVDTGVIESDRLLALTSTSVS
jgi:hypothetical protein